MHYVDGTSRIQLGEHRSQRERSVNAILILARSLLSLSSLEHFFPFSFFPTNRVDIPFAIRMSY